MKLNYTLKMVIFAVFISAYLRGHINAAKHNNACKLVPVCPETGPDCRVYTFAFTSHGNDPGAFFDGRNIFGPRVDLMKEVCCRANKQCKEAFVDFDKCMNQETLSEVLNGRWFDVCLDIVNAPARTAVYLFSSIEFYHLPKPIGLVKVGSSISLSDVKNPNNHLKIAHLANPELASAGMLDKYKEDYFVKPKNVIPIDNGHPNALATRIVNMVNSGEADVGLVPEHFITPGASFKKLFSLDMDFGGTSIMVRKDEPGIIRWWDKTLKTFICSKDYRKFCKKMDKKYGASPNHCVDPKTIC